MSNIVIQLEILGEMPRPLATLCHRLMLEQHPVLKLQRMVDCVEVIVKYAASIAVQSFYAEGLQTQYQKEDHVIRERIQVPTLGHYVEMWRTAYACLQASARDRFAACAKPFSEPGVIDPLLALRTKYKGHGATLESNLAEQLFSQHIQHFRRLLELSQKLAELPLFLIVERQKEGCWLVQRLQGDDTSLPPKEMLEAESLKVGHLIVGRPRSGRLLDLHPLIIALQRNEGQRAVVFFNSKERKEADFLDYVSGQHHLLASSDEATTALAILFPRPAPEQRVPADGELEADWFGDLIVGTTRHFVGRAEERRRLELFGAGGATKVIVVVGPLGVGKTTLLAEWAKKEMCLRHFISEGSAATHETTGVFENLALQLTKTYGLKWQRPNSCQPRDYVQGFCHLLAEAAAKAAAPILILLDGLDEAERATARISQGKAARTLLDWLPDAQTLPKNVRLVLSCRPEMLTSDVFKAKFGVDKAEHLVLSCLKDTEVRAMLNEACNWYEVTATPGLVQTVLKKSEGSPLYIRLLLEDLATGRLSLKDVERLPTGLEAILGRVLDAIEQSARKAGKGELQREFRAKVRVLERLVAQGELSRERFGQLCKDERQELESQASASCLDLLALFAVAKEPLRIEDAAIALGIEQHAAEKGVEPIRGVLEEGCDGRFRIFHGAFRSFFLARRQGIASQLHERLVLWCLRYSEHGHIYALRHCVDHLCDQLAGTSDGQEVKMAQLEGVLTDFDFIRMKAGAGMVANLLSDYENALNSCPGYVRNDPFAVPPVPPLESWVEECVSAVLEGRPDPHPTRGVGAVLGSLRMLGNPAKQKDGISAGYWVNEVELYCATDRGVQASELGGSVRTESLRPPHLDASIGSRGSVEAASAERIAQFYTFVSSLSHILTASGVDVAAMAFNHQSGGYMSEKAAVVLQQKKQSWIKRHNRPAETGGRSGSICTLTGEGEEFLSQDFQRMLVALAKPGESDAGTTVTFRVFDVRTGAEMQRASQVLADDVALCWAGTPVAATDDLRIALFGNAAWDTQDAHLRMWLGGRHLDAFAITPDGRLAVTASQEDGLRVWDVEAGMVVRSLRESMHQREGWEKINALALSRDGRVIAIAREEFPQVQLVDVGTGEAILTFSTSRQVRAVALTGNARFVAFGGREEFVWVFDVGERRLLQRFSHEGEEVQTVALTPDGRFVASQDWRNVLRLWDVKSGQLLRRIRVDGSARRLALSADGALAFAGSHVLDLHQVDPKTVTGDQGAMPVSAALTSDGKTVLVHDRSGRVALCEFGQIDSLLCFEPPAFEQCSAGETTATKVVAVALDAKGDTGLMACANGILYLADIRTRSLRQISSPSVVDPLVKEELAQAEADWIGLNRGANDDKPLSAVVDPWLFNIRWATLTPDGRFALTTRYGDAVRVWSSASGERVAYLPTKIVRRLSEGEVMCLRTALDSQTVVFSTSEGLVHVWRFLEKADSLVLRQDRTKSFVYTKLAVSADGRRIVFGESRGPLELWDIPGARLLRFLGEPPGVLSGLAFTPDGKAVISASGGDSLVHRITAWDAEGGAVITAHPLPGCPISLSEVGSSGRFVCCTDNGEIHYLSLEGDSFCRQ